MLMASGIRMSYRTIVLPYDDVKMYNFVIEEEFIFQHSHRHDIPPQHSLVVADVVGSSSLEFHDDDALEFNHESSRTIPVLSFW